MSSIVASKFLSGSCNCSTSQDEEEEEDVSSCDLFDGRWVEDDDDFEPLYKPGSCPFIDDSFNCFKNGRPDSDYLRLRWKPSGCQLQMRRFDGLKMLKMLRGKRLVFVGDSLNRNMWESLVCSLRESLVNKSRLFEVSGHYEFKTQGYHSFMFKVSAI
nr:protein trichome birefringence-like 4 [Ipomoea batatas]